jgi:leader peptidase (prepilin peptidase)/N-methyltransferase
MILHGKCRNCKKHISVRYPIIELSTGLGFLVLFSLFSQNMILLLYSLFIFSILMLIIIIDFEHKIIPDLFTFLGIAATLIYFIFTDSGMIFLSVLAGLISAILLLLIHLATRGRGMGLGDVKFAILGGMITGISLNIVWLFLAFLTGGVTGIILILGKRAGLKDQIAFGPFLIISIGLALTIGSKLLVFMGLK